MLLTHGAAHLRMKADPIVAERAGRIMRLTALGTLLLFLAAGVLVATHVDGFAITKMAATDSPANPLLKQVIFASKEGKWDAATAAAKSLDSNAALLEKATPKKGDASSWEKLGPKYHKNTSALLTAVEKKDADGVKTAVGTIQGSCKECHSVHKGK
ncbi:cytochrome c, partial [bacterium]|nr:cytochrome c [bacterium]